MAKRRPKPQRPRDDDDATIITVHSEAIEGSSTPQSCQLVVIEGPDMGRAARITSEPLTVGTYEHADLVLSDERVSRMHMTVHEDSGRFVVRDLESRNGTLYQGSLISDATLPLGATLKLGRTFVRIQPTPSALEVQPSQSRRFGDLVAESLFMREVIAVMELAAASDVTVLIEGETGTGKELTARAIHEASARHKRPFVALDCGALPATLLESELFGHVRGAFTGAAHDRLGAFARADGGTIFLDELGSIPLSAQARLLRVLEERMVRPVGADSERAINVRILAASSTALEARVAEGTFRPDLYYRLSVVRVRLPPLRARREDIVPIVKELMRRRGLDAGSISGPNLHRLMAHTWPGNVRELRNVLERAIALSPGARAFKDLRIAIKHTPHEDAPAVRTDLPYSEAKQRLLDAFEQRYLRDVYQRCDGNISAASRASGIDRKHLRTLLRKHNIIE